MGFNSSNGHGIVLKTTYEGVTWNELSSGANQAFFSVYFTDINTGYAVGYMGIIMKTSNGGANWIYLQGGTIDILYSVYFPTPNKGYVVGNSGDILKTNNGGITWTADSSGTWNNLASVFFTDTTTGYVVGYDGTILKTGNGGVDFIEQHITIGTKFAVCPNPANDRITITGTKMIQEEIVIAYNTSTTDRREDFIIVDNRIHQKGETVRFLYGAEGTAEVLSHPDPGNQSLFVKLDLEPMQFVILG